MSRDSGAARPVSVLAAGGKQGVVKLIHAQANVAYGEFRASRKALSTLRFSPRQGNLLFSEWWATGLDRVCLSGLVLL